MRKHTIPIQVFTPDKDEYGNDYSTWFIQASLMEVIEEQQECGGLDNLPWEVHSSPEVEQGVTGEIVK